MATDDDKGVKGIVTMTNQTLPDGRQLAHIHREDGKCGLVPVSEMEDDTPIHEPEYAIASEAVGPHSFGVTIYPNPGSAGRTEASGRTGPVKVNSAAYQSGWERIFGKGPVTDEEVN